MAMRSRGFNFDIYQGEAFADLNVDLINMCDSMRDLIDGELTKLDLI